MDLNATVLLGRELEEEERRCIGASVGALPAARAVITLSEEMARLTMPDHAWRGVDLVVVWARCENRSCTRISFEYFLSGDGMAGGPNTS